MTQPSPVGCLRTKSPASRIRPVALAADPESREHRPLRCRICDAEITDDRERVEVGGAHRHTFSNPAGLLFEIGCFARASGCARHGEHTEEFSWFPGFSWSYAPCATCSAHLGWFFAGGDGASFWGLILNRLTEGGTSS